MDKKQTEKVSRIIKAYAKGTYSADIERDFAEWLTGPGDREAKDDALAELWNGFPAGRTADLDTALLRMKIRLGHPLPQKRRLGRWLRYAAAALLPAAMVIGTILLTNRPSAPEEPQVRLSLLSGDTILHEILPDSSEVWLNRNSSLVYTGMADGSRYAELSGEACFRVTRNGSVFEASVPDVTVRVRGTEFNLREGADEAEVLLYEGAVDVVLPETAISMTAGTALTYSRETGEVSTGPISKGHIDWRFDMLNFRGEDIASILQRVCRHHGLTLSLPAQGLPADPITVRFDGREDIDHTMFVLQQLSGRFEYGIDGEKMTVTPK